MTNDFIRWDAELTTYREPGKSWVAGCLDCHTPQHGKKVYCHLHRCRATNSRGKRCGQPADEASQLYCRSHGCQHLLQRQTPDQPAMRCNERSVLVLDRVGDCWIGSRCLIHHRIDGHMGELHPRYGGLFDREHESLMRAAVEATGQDRAARVRVSQDKHGDE
jgi:hypothetical protein